jgi:hypothetical protein
MKCASCRAAHLSTAASLARQCQDEAATRISFVIFSLFRTTANKHTITLCRFQSIILFERAVACKPESPPPPPGRAGPAARGRNRRD